MPTTLKYIVLLVLLGGTFAACYKDKGNYDITPVDEIKIGGPAFVADNFTLAQFDTLRIKPEFTYSGDQNNLQFTWKLFPPSAKPGDSTIQLISSSAELEYRVRVPIGGYTVLLEIKDKQTNITRSRIFGMNVRAKGSQGFMVLTTKANGEQDIDVIPDNTKPDIISGVFSANNNFVLKDATRLHVLQSFTNINGLVYVFLKSGGYTLLPSYTLLQEAKYWFFSPPAQFAPTAIYQDQFGQNIFLVNNGSVHYTVYANAPALFNSRAAGNYKATATFLSGSYAIAYDDLNHRFLRLNKAAGTMNAITVNPEDKFNVNNIGNKSCFLFDHNMQPGVTPGNTNYNLVKPIAFCKDNETGKVYAYKFGFFRSLVTYAESVTEITAPGFATATAYVNASNNPLTYYAVGNKIYAYDLANDASRLVYTVADENVTIDRLMTNGTQLLAAINKKDSHSGSVYFFKVMGTGNFENDTHFAKYDGFSRIVDVHYKNNIINTGPGWK